MSEEISVERVGVIGLGHSRLSGFTSESVNTDKALYYTDAGNCDVLLCAIVNWVDGVEPLSVLPQA